MQPKNIPAMFPNNETNKTESTTLPVNPGTTVLPHQLPPQTPIVLANQDSTAGMEAFQKQLTINYQMQNELQKKMYIQEQDDKSKRLVFESQHKAGMASDNFRAQMETELKEGRYTPYYYSPIIATKRGTLLNYSISGYTIILEAGKSTNIPTVLLKQLYDFVEASRILHPGMGFQAGRNSKPLTNEDRHFLEAVSPKLPNA